MARDSGFNLKPGAGKQGAPPARAAMFDAAVVPKLASSRSQARWVIAVGAGIITNSPKFPIKL